MVRISVHIDDGVLRQFQTALARFGTERSFPAVAGALKESARFVQATWVDYACGGALPGVLPLSKPSSTYAHSIKTRPAGPFAHEIYSDAPIASRIENGTSELDMKRTHTHGPRSRVSKKGVPYLIVPFRWGTPGAKGFKNVLPSAIYTMLKNRNRFKRSSVLDTVHGERNAAGDEVQRREYNWGSRLTGADIPENMAGLVAMDVGTARRQYTNYFTFRVISAEQPAYMWVRNAVPGRPVTQALKNVTAEPIANIVNDALKEDLAGL